MALINKTFTCLHDKVRTTHPIITKFGSYIPLVMLITWINCRGILSDNVFGITFFKSLDVFLQGQTLWWPYFRNGWMYYGIGQGEFRHQCAFNTSSFLSIFTIIFQVNFVCVFIVGMLAICLCYQYVINIVIHFCRWVCLSNWRQVLESCIMPFRRNQCVGSTKRFCHFIYMTLFVATCYAVKSKSILTLHLWIMQTLWLHIWIIGTDSDYCLGRGQDF